MPFWWTWSFLANQCFLGKTMEKYIIVPSSGEFFRKKFYWSRRFQFWHPSRKHLPRSGISSFKFSKQSQNFFGRNFLSQSVFLDTWNAVLTNLQKLFRQKTATFPSLPERQKSLVCDNFFGSKCSSAHVECLPSSFKFYLKWLWTRRFQFDATGGYFCQGFGTLPLNVEKRFKVVFLMKKNHSNPKAPLITWTAVLTFLSNVFCQ